jgi:hypothetical protein
MTSTDSKQVSLIDFLSSKGKNKILPESSLIELDIKIEYMTKQPS